MDNHSVSQIAARAKEASHALAVSGEERNNALKFISDNIFRETENILIQNKKDMSNADKSKIPESLKDRMLLTKDRIYDICKSISDICGAPDPVGRVLGGRTTSEGMKISKISVPIGVIGVIYESRPNVTAEGAALCIKSGNSVILRGGKESVKSNIYIGTDKRRT